MAKTKFTLWFLPIAGIPLLLIGIFMVRSSLGEVEGANLFGLLTGLTLLLGGFGLLFVGIRAMLAKSPDGENSLAEEPTSQ